jgi:hypothetical protein
METLERYLLELRAARRSRPRYATRWSASVLRLLRGSGWAHTAPRWRAPTPDDR